MSPARSKSQQRLFAAAAHGADFAKAEELRSSMSLSKLNEFATGSMKNKPEKITQPTKKRITPRV